MDKMIKGLFDYQRFEENDKLARIIKMTEDKYSGKELALDELEMVNAAGISAPMQSVPSIINKE